MTAKEQLVSVLADLKEARQSLEDYKRECLKAQQIEKESLADQSLSEDEAVDRIAKAQARIQVHQARIAERQSIVDRIEKELVGFNRQSELASAFKPGLLVAVADELRGEYKTLLDARTALLKGRVLEVLHITDVAMVPSLSQILHRSPLLAVIAQCHPPQINPNVSGEQQAQDLLFKFEVLAKEKAKSI
jgi:hypothetical protein